MLPRVQPMANQAPLQSMLQGTLGLLDSAGGKEAEEPEVRRFAIAVVPMRVRPRSLAVF